MPLPPLVDSPDLTRFGYDTTTVTDAYLERASARVRRYTRQTITEEISDTVTRRGFSPLSLPQRPVNEVTSVTWLDGRDVPEFTVVGSLLYLRDLVTPTMEIPPLYRPNANCQPTTVIVTYDHGYSELPDDLVELVCAVAARLAGSRSTGESKQLTVGGYSETFTTESIEGASGLLPNEERSLDVMFPRVQRQATVVLP